jgi:alpha-galactosidase
MSEYLRIIIISIILSFLCSCVNKKIVNSGDLCLEVNDKMETRINLNQVSQKTLTADFAESEYLLSQGDKIGNFTLESIVSTKIRSKPGYVKMYEYEGYYRNDDISLNKILRIKKYDEFPDMITTQVIYKNTGKNSITIDSWINNRYSIYNSDNSPSFWSFQGSSTSNRSDWVLEVVPGFYQKNYMGMNDSDYGGGIPVSCLWRKDGGIAVGHCATTPQLVSLPVTMDENSTEAILCVQKDYKKGLILNPGDSIKTLETFVMLQKGDYFSSLRKYSNFMYANGMPQPEYEEWAYESKWSAWGYERNFTVEEILNTLPKVKELGIKWAVIDDGYQQCEGDWQLNLDKFPNGDEQMKQLVDKIHDFGLKAQIWWAPLAADPESNYLKKYPNTLLLSEEGMPRHISWWDSYYLSPVDSTVTSSSKEQVAKFMKDYGFDGLKIDGQHINAVPPDFAHGQCSLNAVQNLSTFYKILYDEAKSINPHAVLHYCPCGCCVSFFNLPYINQAVASDPTSSWQIRLKGKTIKALAPKLAYYGDHVELSDSRSDFASSFGIGAVLGTKFTWPKDNPSVKDEFLLTPEKEKVWKQWFLLYNEMMLSKGEYLGELYDLCYDKPETHVIVRDNKFYYAFYAKNWEGAVEFRGLDSQKYRIYDYVHNKNLGEINGPVGQLNINFRDYCLVEAIPL